MPEDTLPSLRKLMDDCWAPLPSARPAFGEVNNRLDEILVEAAITDEKGREFWKANFLKNRFVPWEEFSKAFYKFVGVNLPHDDAAVDSKKKGAPASAPVNVNVGPEVLRMRCFREIVAQKEGSAKSGERTTVDIQHFGRVLGWYGPLKTVGKDILTNIEAICREQWFHGDIDASEAIIKLNGSAPGSFLVRYSTITANFTGAFTISRVTDDQSIVHVKIERGDGGYVLHDEFKTLVELIHFVAPADKLNLKSAVSGSRFAAVFQTSAHTQPVYAPVIKKPGSK